MIKSAKLYKKIQQIQIVNNIRYIKNQIQFLLQILKILQLIVKKTKSQSKQVYTKMQSIMFTSFGLLLTLMLHKTKSKFKIIKQIDLTIYPHPPQIILTNDTLQKQSYTPQKKKKPKKNRKLQKVQTQQFIIYPKTILSEQNIEIQWQNKQQIRKNRCINIGKQIQALQSYFLDDLQTILMFNGYHGKYQLKIAIPQATYSDITIDINIQQNYPIQLPQIQINTSNLHPLEKQKLFEIIKQQRTLFQNTKVAHFTSNQLSNTNATTSSYSQSLNLYQQLQQSYLTAYYYYILNLCITISQQLFYRAESNILNEVQLSPNFDMKTLQRQKTDNLNFAITTKNIQKLKQQMQTKKQILQNVVQQILNRDDDQQKYLINLQKPLEYNIAKLPNPRGRYKTDYEQLQMIGQGGFGRVYRCKHRIDSNIYAVKKMVINYNDPKSFKLLKQVSFLSKLNHPNIVRYHQSWLQDTSSVEQLVMDMKITDPQQIKQFNRIWNKYSSQHPSNSDKMIMRELDQQQSDSQQNYRSQQDSVIFGDDIVFGDYSSYPDFGKSLRGEQDNRIFQDQDESFSRTSQIKDKNQMSRKHSEIYQFPFKILYVVMEYCGSMTLKDFINKKFEESNDVKIKLIRGMLEGLSYIHSRRIMHRDLKPANIFLIENMNKVKIGDFGLATIGNIENNPYEAQIIQYSEKTRGVGTTFYRAPEQLQSSFYDQKIDIYSLGIILLQMFYQFGTNMERYQVLNQVTRTHRLPRDFNKYQNNSQFEQQIQSCLSLKPSDRPTVQKLLQTFRNKYFTQLMSLIANPKHFQFYQLMNHVFGIKNETNVIMKQNLFKNYLTFQFTKIYQIHRGVLFAPLSLIPVVDFDTLNGIKIPVTRKQKFLLLSQRGVVMQYPSNAYTSWIRYAKQTLKRNSKNQGHNNYKQDYLDTNKQMRRFTFEKVSQFIGGDLKSQFSFKQKYVTAFDITYQIQNDLNPYFICQMLKISVLMVSTMQLTQKMPPLYLCHSLIFKCLAIQYNVSVTAVHRFLLSVTDEKFKSLKNQMKVQYLKNFGIQGNFVKRIISLLQSQFQNEEQFIKSFRQRAKENQHSKIQGEKQRLRLIDQIQQQILSTIQSLKIFQLYERVKWKFQIPLANTFGMFWSVGPVKGFTAIQQYLPQQQLCNLHLETLLNPNLEQNEADVSVWSNGQFLEKDIMQVVAKCWENNITVKWYDQNLGEKDLSCRYNIILKKKNERVYMMLRKNHISLQRSLQKKISQQTKDKQEKQSAFILKQHFNYDVLKILTRQNQKKIMSFH